MEGVIRSGGDGQGARRRLSPLWYLIYLGLLLFHPLLDPEAGVVHWAAIVVVAAAFVPLYLAVYHGLPWAQRWGPHLATAMGVAALPLNNSAGVLLVYAAAFAGMTRARRNALHWFVVLTIITIGAALLAPIPVPYLFLTFIPSALFIWVVGTACLDEAEQERETVARCSTRAQRLAQADPERATAEMEEVEEVARAALAEVRATVRGWRHIALDDELSAATDALAAAGVELLVDRDRDLRLSPSAETALSLALREAVTNVVRHAHARRCTVALRRDDDEVVLHVADDGVGGDHQEGAGLTGMRERLAALGGHVERPATGGTALRIAVPATVAT